MAKPWCHLCNAKIELNEFAGFDFVLFSTGGGGGVSYKK
jgi:hypothetical protein